MNVLKIISLTLLMCLTAQGFGAAAAASAGEGAAGGHSLEDLIGLERIYREKVKAQQDNLGCLLEKIKGEITNLALQHEQCKHGVELPDYHY